MTSTASVDLRLGEFIVASYSLTEAGFWIANGVFYRVPDSAAPPELGSAVFSALNASRQNVATPPRHGPSPFDPILKAVKVPSYSKYMEGMRSVGVTSSSDTVVVTPMRNGGKAEGFVELTELALSVADPSADQLGEAIRHAITRAQ